MPSLSIFRGTPSRPRVFWAALSTWLVLVGGTLAFPERSALWLQSVKHWAIFAFGDVYIVALTLFLCFVFGLSLTPLGRKRLGGPNAKAQFGRFSWYAMLLSAGMGIGLVFNGVAEPLLLYDGPVEGASRSAQALAQAMPLTYFHWGFSPWAGYVMMALAVAWVAYGEQGRFSLRETLRPLAGRLVDGWLGDLVDLSAVLGTLVGLAASLGLGARQIVTGLSRLGWFEPSTEAVLILILLITLGATASLLSGLERGIRRISEFNLAVTLLLGIFVFALGPSSTILSNLCANTLHYFELLLDRALLLSSQAPEQEAWMQRWTIPYWAWWISWAPFVGIFMARISKGRTVRELVWSGVLVPSLATFAWFEIFGGAALELPKAQRDTLSDAVVQDLSTSVFVYLETLPFSGLSSILAMILVAVFFVSSSDSASFVVDMLTSGGHPDPPRWQRVFWAVAEGLCAAMLIYIGGQDSLNAMHALVIASAVPYTLCMLAMVAALCWAFWRERRRAGISR